MNDRLNSAMRRLAEECALQQLPPQLETALLAEFERERRRNRISWIAGLAAAASILTLVSWHDPLLLKRTAPQPVSSDDQTFVPIPYVAPPASYERIEVIRMEVPIAALIAAGLTVRTADLGARVEADVVVGQDGRARAVRLVSDESLN